MSAKIELCGKYTKTGSVLSSTEHTLLISERKSPSPNKTKFFLVYKAENSKDNFYISSLFPEGSAYNMDYDGIKYSLESKGKEIVITKRSQN